MGYPGIREGGLIMTFRPAFAWALAAALLCGCATTGSSRNNLHHDGPFYQELGHPQDGRFHELTASACRVPCANSPGPGCC